MLGYRRNVTYAEMLREGYCNLLYGESLQAWQVLAAIQCDCVGGDQDILVLYTDINSYLVLGVDDSLRL